MTTRDIAELRGTHAANPMAPASTRQDFSGTEMVERGLEQAATAIAAQAKANVEARYIMALRRPRNIDDVRDALLRECRRPAFAHNKSTLYHKPIGGGVEGLGIRFIETALRCMTNILTDTLTVYEDDDRENIIVTVTDLEANLTFSQAVKITKTVERSRPAADGTYISVRKNTQGRDVYTVHATDDDLLNKRGALISKAIRNLGARIIPGDLQDEAEEIIRAVRTDRAAKDPEAERKRIADAFGQLGIRPSELKAYLGHELGQCTSEELVKLRGLYGSIRDGEAAWADIAGDIERDAPIETPAAMAERKREQAPLDEEPADGYPRKFGHGQYDWVDSTGLIYNPECLGWDKENNRPASTKDGRFKAARGYREEAEKYRNEQAAKQQASAESSVESSSDSFGGLE